MSLVLLSLLALTVIEINYLVQYICKKNNFLILKIIAYQPHAFLNKYTLELLLIQSLMKLNDPLTIKKGLQLCPDICMCSYIGYIYVSYNLSNDRNITQTMY